MRRWNVVRLTVLTVLAIALAGLVRAGASAGAPATIAGSLSVTPTPAIVSESVTAAGSFPTPVARPVMLHQKVGASWVRVAAGSTSSDGAFTFPFTSPSTVGTTTLRAYAPAATVDGTDHPPLLTPNTTFTTVAQTGTVQWTMEHANSYVTSEAWFAIDERIRLKASFTPARPGRRVVFQRLVGGVWTKVASGTQSVNGLTVILRGFPLGEHVVRALTVAADGAPGRTTNNLDVATYQRGSVSLVADGHVPVERYAVDHTRVPGPDWDTHYSDRVVVRDDDTATTVEVPLPEGKTDTLSGSVTDAGEVVYVAAACTWEWVEVIPGGEGYWAHVCGSYGIYSWSWSGAPTLLRPGFSARVSPDGDSLIYAATIGTSSRSPLLMLDRDTDATSQITPTGYQWHSYRASADFGRVVVDALSFDPTDAVYLWDRGSGTRAVIGNGTYPSISADGSRATYLAADGDVAAYDVDLQTTTDLGPSMAGNEGPRVSAYRPLLDAAGDQVALTTGVVRGPSYVVDVATGRRMPVHVTAAGVFANAGTRLVGISADGDSVYFVTTATNLDPADTTNDLDLYVWQRP